MPSATNPLSAAEAARRIARRELSSEALVAACLERIAAREREVQAWAFLDPELALKQARALDREKPRGPLHGVPVGIKDIFDTVDMPTEYGSAIYRGYQPRWDAACVALLRRAGCVILGKTVTTEFAHVHPGKTRNPRKPAQPGRLVERIGGRRRGLHDAARARHADRRFHHPSRAFCGTVACKPSFSSINRAGLKFAAESLDTIGVFARSAEDAALGLHVLSGRAVPDFRQGPDRKPRVGLCRTPRWRDADAATHAAIERVAAQLAKAGAQVAEFDLPEGCAQLFEEHGKIMNYESARALAWEYLNHVDQISATLRPRIEEGWKTTRAAYDAARRLARDCRRGLAARMVDCDFLITPSAPGEAPARWRRPATRYSTACGRCSACHA